MTETAYEKIDAVRFSRLRAMAKSALQYAHEVAVERDDAVHYRIGRATHTLSLEPHLFDRDYVVYTEPKNRGEGSKKRWEQAQADAAANGQTILDGKEHEAAIGASAAMLRHPVASRYLQGGEREHLVLWTDPETGLRCKARLDLASDHLVDIKSAREIRPRLFAATAARLSYFGQLAFYLDGATAAGLSLSPTPILIAVESSPPFDVIVYRVPAPSVEYGRAEYRRLLARLKECRELDSWPGLAPTEPLDLIVPDWAFAGSAPLELVMPDGESLHV